MGWFNFIKSIQKIKLGHPIPNGFSYYRWEQIPEAYLFAYRRDKKLWSVGIHLCWRFKIIPAYTSNALGDTE